MGSPEMKARMESSEKMKQEEMSAAVEVAGDSPKDQLAWAQFMHDFPFFADLSGFSPKGLNITPPGSPGGFPDLSAICSSPVSFLEGTCATPRPALNSSVVACEPESSHVPVVVAPESAPASDLKQIDLSRVLSNSAELGVSKPVTTSCESEETPCCSSDVKPGASCAESTASGDERSRHRKRKSGELDVEALENVEIVDEVDTSDAEENNMEDSKDLAHKSSSRCKQQKLRDPKRSQEPHYIIKTRTEADIMEDGYKWRKYGQKPVKNSPHPRNYYRCTTANCPVRKRVERSNEEPGLVVASYEGTHTHPKVNQPKRTASGNVAPMEAAESLSDCLNQLQNRQQQAAASANPAAAAPSAPFPQLHNLFPGFPGWPSLMNRQMPPMAGALPSLQDTVGLMMAYQSLRLQWEFQAKAQQFMSYTAQAQNSGGFSGGLVPKVNPLMNPFGFLQAVQNLGMPDMAKVMQNFGESSNSNVESGRMKSIPEVPDSGSGNLLARCAAAQRGGFPMNPSLQSNAVKMQQFMAQAMAGLALQGQERLQDEREADQGQ